MVVILDLICWLFQLIQLDNGQGHGNLKHVSWASMTVGRGRNRMGNCLTKYKMESEQLSFSYRVGFSVSWILFPLLCWFKKKTSLSHFKQIIFLFSLTDTECPFPSILLKKLYICKFTVICQDLFFSPVNRSMFPWLSLFSGLLHQ